MIHSAGKYTRREYQRCRFPTSHVCTLTTQPSPHTRHKIATAVSCQRQNNIIESIPDLHSGHKAFQTLVFSMYFHPGVMPILSKCLQFIFKPQSSKPFHSTCPSHFSIFLLTAMSPIPCCFLACSFFQSPTANDSSFSLHSCLSIFQPPHSLLTFYYCRSHSSSCMIPVHDSLTFDAHCIS